MKLSSDQFQLQADISRKLFENLDSDKVITVVCQELLEVLDYTTITISLYDKEKETIRVLVEFDRINRSFPTPPSYSLSDFPTSKKVIIEQKVSYVNKSDPDADPVEIGFLDEFDDKCLLMVPLVFQGNTIGLIEFWDSFREHHYADQELEFVRSVCNVAAVAVHNFTFVDQLRRQKNELRMLFGAAEELTSNLDYREALQVITRKVLTIFNVAWVDFLFVDRDTDELEILTTAINPEVTEVSSEDGLRFKISDWPYIQECIQTASPVTLYIDESEVTEQIKKNLDSWNEKSNLAIPVIYQGRVLGIIDVVETRQIIHFNETDIRLAVILADFAAAVLNNLLLFEETAKRNSEMTTVMNVMKDITSSVDIDTVLTSLTNRLSEVLDLYGVDIYFYNAEHKHFESGAFTAGDDSGAWWENIYTVEDQPVFERCLRERCIIEIHIDDPDLDDKTRDEMDEWEEKSELILPMIYKNEFLGIACLYESRHIRRFSEEDKRLASIIVSQGAIAIENARNYDREQQGRKHQELMNKRLGAIIEMSDQLRGISDINETLAFIGRHISYEMGYNAWTVFMFEETRLHLVVASSHITGSSNIANNDNKIIHVEMFSKLTRQADKISKSSFIDSFKYEWTEEEKTYFPQQIKDSRKPNQWQAGDRLLIPMADDQNVLLGYIEVYDPIDKMRPSVEMIKILEILAAKASYAISLRKLHQRLEQQAITDGLTGLFNHRHLQERLIEEVTKAGRYGLDLSFIMIDIDNFKKLNDTYGHPQGDKVLKELAEILTDCTRAKVDIVARYGGEEFFIVLPNTPFPQVLCVADRLLHTTSGNKFESTPGKRDLTVTLSIGVVSFPEDGATVTELIANCDKAMYHAKHNGKNRVCVFSKDMSSEIILPDAVSVIS